MTNMNIKHSVFSTIILFVFVTNVLGQSDSIQEKGLKKYWNSLFYGNIDRTFEKKMDMSFVVAPCYTKEGSFGIGGAATALYRLDRKDSIMQPSDISLSGSATINGFYGITIKGNNHFKGNKARLSYRLQFQHKTLDFWGITYDACNVNPISEYTKRLVNWESDYVYKLTKNIHVGAALNIKYADLAKMANPAYLEGQRKAYFFTGLGVSIQYNRMWSGSFLAFDLYGQFNNQYTPWPLREELGSGDSRMRGYYGGRYIDCNQMTAQLELRQHIYSRIGCVAWMGCGTVFPSFDKLKVEHILPNYGIGLRIEFKHNVNVRIDYGFGKDTAGFLFQFAEAF